ncbi:hypothetical protein FSP39_012400 [Pinctada imbricata]|uniref:Caspase-8 n=1 Tax=Pinctada imbricata TaxID=66713 RepID=A0AA88Y3H5_PINIB|nr:hypothetical protein FSP39_012400 [Pinctada imbricata]
MSDRQTRYDLIKLQQELDTDDFSRLKYLTKDRVKRNKLSELKSTLDLFERLEEVGAISVKNGDVGFLLEALLLMDKKKLIRTFHETPDDVKGRYNGNKSNFTPFRRLFFTLGECMGSEERIKIKDYLKREHRIRKGTLEKAGDIWQLLTLLEENLPSPDIQTLQKIISLFDDEAVHEEFEKFKKGEPTGIHNSECADEESSSPVQASTTDVEPPSVDAPPSVDGLRDVNQEKRMMSYEFKQPAGFCLIINNEKFDNESVFKRRYGTDRDRDALKKTFEYFGFDVKVKENFTANEMKDWLREYSMVDHTHHSALVVCILSHGNNGVVYGKDGQGISIEDLLSYFKPDVCPSLTDKPKMFFIQACQVWTGNDPTPNEAVSDAQNVSQGTYSQESRTSCIPIIPMDADFLLGMATVTNYVSYRTNEGSFYIQSLTKNLMKFSPREDVLSILTEVNREVANETAVCESRMAKQIPEPRSRLRKKVYLNPKS